MPNTIRIKRSTSTNAPTTLQNAELAYSELSGKLFIGVGTGGSGGSATTIVPIGGIGAFTDLTSNQTIGGTKTFSLAPVVPNPSASDQAVNKGYVDTALSNISLTGYAPLASPALTGVPTAPTATAGNNSTQLATTAFVSTAVSNLVAAAPAALDTLNELATALGNDANFATTISTSIGTKLSKASNLSDLLSVATARTNLGLGTLAVQNANNVAITGGTIDGITVDGGTF